MEELDIKLETLRILLKNRGNNAHTFFEKIIKQMDNINDEYLDLLLGASPIVQYGNFTYKEENLFKEIWYLTKEIKDNMNKG